MIALLCPSKGRPEKLQRMVQSAYDTTTSKVQIFVAVSPEEFESYKAVLNIPENDRVGLVIVTMPELSPTGFKWNKLAELAMTQDNKLFMIAGDDMIFDTPAWDEALLCRRESFADKIEVFALQDSRDKDGTPHPIISREYIEAMGYLIPPIFLHWHIDTWTVEIARASSRFTHLRDYKLIHDKPSDKGEPDATHTGISSYGWKQHDDYINKKMQSCLLNEKMRLRAYIQGQRAA